MAYDKSVFRKLNKGGLTQEAALLLATWFKEYDDFVEGTALFPAAPVEDLESDAELADVIATLNELMGKMRGSGLLSES